MLSKFTARLAAGLLAALCAAGASVAAEVHFAGLAFSGSADTIDTRFPNSRRYLDGLARDKVRVAAMIHQTLQAQKPTQFEIAPLAAQAELAGQDQTIVLAMVINNETVSLERIGGLAKFFVQLRAQALFFDFKSMTVLRAYPLSFAYIDLLDHTPSQTEVDERMRLVFNGTDKKPGLFARFASAVQQASLPSGTPRFLQVTQASVAPEARAGFPPALNEIDGAAETWAADMLGESISQRLGLPILPYAKGAAIGKVMSMKVADGEVYNLKLPEPDYTLSVQLTGVKKVELQKTAAETAYVYGAYANVKLDEPFSNKSYLDLALKNGETKTVPATQRTVDDLPAYADAMRGLFNKLADNLGGKTTPWLKTAASGNQIDKQINQSTEILKSCK